MSSNHAETNNLVVLQRSEIVVLNPKDYANQPPGDSPMALTLDETRDNLISRHAIASGPTR